MEKYARQALSEGVKKAEDLNVTEDCELLRVLNLHYNRSNHIPVSALVWLSWTTQRGGVAITTTTVWHLFFLQLLTSCFSFFPLCSYFQIPDNFRSVSEITLHEFFRALQQNKDTEQSWKKAIYKVIARLDDNVPEYFKNPNFIEQID